MAIPSVVAVGAVAAGTGDVVPGLPSGWAADDIHIMVVEQSAVNTFGSAPSGWVLVTGTQQKAGSGADDGNIQVYWRRAVAGDTDPTVTDTINHTSARILGVRGCITSGNPWDVVTAGTAAAGTLVSITGGTTTVNDCLIVAVVGTGPDIASTTEIGSWANASLSSVTERMDNWNTNGNGGGFGMATGGLATAGAYNATTATLVTSSTQAFCTIALKPPGGTQTPKSVDGGMTPSGTIAKQDNKPVSGAVSSITGAIAKQDNKVVSGALSSIVGSLANQTNKVLSGAVSTIAGTLTASRLYNQIVSGAITSIVGGLTNQGQKTLAGSLSTITGTLTRQTNKVTAGALSSIAGTLAKQTNKVLSGAVSSIAGALNAIKIALISLSGGMTPSGALTKQTAKILEGTQTSAGALVRSTTKSLAGSVSTITGALTRQTNKVFDGGVAIAGTVSRSITKALSGSVASAGILSKSIAKILSGALSSIIGALDSVFTGGGGPALTYSLGGLVRVKARGTYAASSRGNIRQQDTTIEADPRGNYKAKARD